MNTHIIEACGQIFLSDSANLGSPELSFEVESKGKSLLLMGSLINTIIGNLMISVC